MTFLYTMTSTTSDNGYDVTYASFATTTNTSAESRDDSSDYQYNLGTGSTLASFLLAILAVVALITNSLLIWVIARSSQLRTSTNAFILSIACSDFLLGIFVVLPSATILHHQPRSEHTCRALGVFSVLSQSVTAHSLMMVSVDRCVAVTWSLKYSQLLTSTSVAAMLAGVWLLSTAFALMPVLGWGQFQYNPGKFFCTLDWDTSMHYIIAQRTCCFLLPWIVIAVMFALIIKSACAHRRIFSMMPMPGLALAVGAAPVVNYRRSTLQAMKTLFFIVAALTILWTPNLVLDFIYYYLPSDQKRSLSPVTMATGSYLAYLSCILNPFVFLTNKKYKHRLKELVGSLNTTWSRNRVHVVEQCQSRLTTMTPLPSSHDSLSCSHVSLSTASLSSVHSSRQLFIDTKASTLKVPTLITVSPARAPLQGSGEPILPFVTPRDVPDIIISSVSDDGEQIIHVSPSPSRRPSQEHLSPRVPEVVQSNADITIHVPTRCNLSTI